MSLFCTSCVVHHVTSNSWFYFSSPILPYIRLQLFCTASVCLDLPHLLFSSLILPACISDISPEITVLLLQLHLLKCGVLSWQTIRLFLFGWLFSEPINGFISPLLLKDRCMRVHNSQWAVNTLSAFSQIQGKSLPRKGRVWHYFDTASVWLPSFKHLTIVLW